MVEIAPFRALRLKSEKKGADISSFICPPYDVISPQERDSIERKNPNNVVRLELPKGSESEKFKGAAALLHRWIAEGTLQEDRVPSLYLLETTFQIKDSFAPSKPLKRYGVLTSLQLETPGKGAIHPHEKTLPKAKEERLNLITALRTDVSPIFGLFFDKKKAWGKWVKKVIKEKPLVQGRESRSLFHRLWKVEAPVLQKELRSILKSKDLYIADGHHRYEVAWAYSEQRLTEESSAGLNEAWRYVMTYVCPMEEPGLLMLPTHRLVKSQHSLQDWRDHLSSMFDVRSVPNMKSLIQELIDSKSGKIGWVYAGGKAILTLKSGLSLDLILGTRPPALRALDVVLLHDAAMGEAVKPDFLKEREVVFTRDLAAMETLVNKDPAWVGFVLGSPGVESLAKVAEANEVMPPKTTYFYPKVPTGFTLMHKEQLIR
ncbi:MAG: hypothetical protein KCHDKBKB_01230 [Elusimicrobia bacterium]|nr:hypothetical protein [Elusimicrobiota bacterium]